jgi:hypothetical protein
MQGTLSCMLGPSHCLHEISLPKKSLSPFLAWANTPRYWEHPWGTDLEPREHMGKLKGTESTY